MFLLNLNSVQHFYSQPLLFLARVQLYFLIRLIDLVEQSLLACIQVSLFVHKNEATVIWKHLVHYLTNKLEQRNLESIFIKLQYHTTQFSPFHSYYKIVTRNYKSFQT